MVGTEDDFSFCMKTLLDRLVAGEGVRCGVCMRGEEEITLVQPRRVKELIQYHGFKIFEPIESSVPWACVLCESAAAHALRAHRALRTAARVAALVTDLRLNGTPCNTRTNNSAARRAMWRECEAMLRAVRGARRLVRTDVLLVDSTVPGPGTLPRPGPRPGTLPRPGHKRAAMKTSSGSQTITPLSSEIETVIVEDDEDPLAMTPALPVLGPPSTAPPTTAPPSTGKLVQLTPLVSLYNASNVLYVPQHNNNQDVIVFIDNDCTVQKDDITQLMLKGTDDGARKRARLGGAGGCGPPGGTGGTGSPNHYVVDIDDVTCMIKEQTRKKQSQDESNSSVPIRPAEKAWGTGKGAERGTEREAGSAMPNGARVDWEDKIPMDVISFMDATDPNAAELIVPERGLALGGTWGPPPRPDPPFIDLS